MSRDRQAAAPAPAWWRRLWSRGPERRARARAAHALYGALVAQARSAGFYRDLGIPDTPDGRFEMIALHAVLVFRALRRHGPEGRALVQALFDVLVDDLDRSLREMGVGDLSVGKYVKRLAGRLYGHGRRLEEALDTADAEALAALLEERVYGPNAPPAAGQASALAAYVLAQERWLGAWPADEALAGRLSFAAPPAAPM